VKPRLRLSRPSAPGGAHPGVRRTSAFATIALIALALLSAAPVAATSATMAPACDGINIRSSASTSAAPVIKLGTAAIVTVSGTVAGGSWAATCPTSKAGSTWYTVTAINGTAVASLYGAATVYAATGVLTNPATSGAATAGPTAAATSAPTAGVHHAG